MPHTSPHYSPLVNSNLTTPALTIRLSHDSSSQFLRTYSSQVTPTHLQLSCRWNTSPYTGRKGTLLGVYAFAIPLTSPIFQLLSKQIHVYIPAIVRVCYRPFTINYYPLQWGEIPKEHRARCGGTDVLIRRRQRVQETAERQR